MLATTTWMTQQSLMFVDGLRLGLDADWILIAAGVDVENVVLMPSWSIIKLSIVVQPPNRRNRVWSKIWRRDTFASWRRTLTKFHQTTLTMQDAQMNDGGIKYSVIVRSWIPDVLRSLVRKLNCIEQKPSTE